MSDSISGELIHRLESLNDRELALVLGSLLLRDSAPLGASQLTDEQKLEAVDTLVQDVSKHFPRHHLTGILRPLVSPGPISIFIDLLGGALVEGLDTKVKLVTFAAIAARYGLGSLLEKNSAAKGK